MNSDEEDFKAWKEIYRSGHLAYIWRIIRVFLNDFILLEVATLILIKIGITRAYGVPMMLCEALCFVFLGIGYAEYAQAAPTLYLLTFDNLQRMRPMRVRQATGGIGLIDTRDVRATIEVYQNRYADYPVALNYPQLSMANIADTFGQAFLMFPMTSRGSGLARGVELSIDTRLSTRFRFIATLTYARNWYSGLDEVLRRGNYDLPLVANIGVTRSIGKRMLISMRYSTASGRPYTPDNLALSFAQNRDVYDLSHINGARSSAYKRLDFRVEHSRNFEHGILTWHVGIENALGTSNFYSNQWRPRCPRCGVLEQDQMPRLPDGGVQYTF